jgi:glycosyltransferase involved in cell wall biosynthesis
MPHFSIITTCKGRLAHLRQSLPRCLAQPDSESIVVDYDCPDGTAAAVARDFPAARVVAVHGAPVLSIARGRNQGAAVAQGEWLVFLDADILIAPDFVSRLKPILQRGRIYRFGPSKGRVTGTNGSCILHRSDYAASGGYDEAMECYGGEDNDFYYRLELLGVPSELLDLSLIDAVVAHDDAARVRFTRYGSKIRHQRVNSAYIIVKGTLLRQLGPGGLSPEQCRTLYGLVRDVVDQTHDKLDQPVHFTLDMPPDPGFMPMPAWNATRQIVFNLQPKDLIAPGVEEEA